MPFSDRRKARLTRIRAVLLALLLAVPLHLRAQTPEPAPAPAQPEKPGDIHISRLTAPVEVDGHLGDAGWEGATRIDTFWETNPGENVPPKVRSVAWLAYDDHYLYAAFDFEDDPKTIRAPIGDHDNVPSSTDYGGVILDTRNDGRSAVMLLVNANNVQYDAITDDASGEDSSYDLYWDSAARINDHGWTLEIRVPFSSLRYGSGDPQTWGVLLYRNRPRDFRYQMFSSPMRRGANCFICHERKLTGLAGLPSGQHLVLAPYTTAHQDSAPRDGLGTPLENGSANWDAGIDAKWTPTANTAIDATINPDFSQIESDAAQIAANERFALFFSEKRPFFLEGLNLFSTPIQAVYTRTITSPRWGARATGETAGVGYTFLVTQDRGGGSVIIPGPDFSLLAPQDFSSTVAVGRMRKVFGRSFASLLVTDREISGGGHNRVLGPDFQWRPTGSDTVTGQLLVSDSQTPDRSDLADEWDGRSLRSHAAQVAWEHSTRGVYSIVSLKDFGDDFRADVGFVPQVGYREGIAEIGPHFYPKSGILNRIRPYVRVRYDEDAQGNLLLRRAFPGIDLEGIWNGFLESYILFDRTRAGNRYFDTQQLAWYLQLSPSSWLNRLVFEGNYGDQIDFANSRLGSGASLTLRATWRPSDHLELRFDGSRRWLDLEEGPFRGDRLFTAEVARLNTTWSVSSRTFVRLIGQEVRTVRDPALYASAVPPKDDDLAGSALFAYKLNWQTVLFLGYGDERTFLEPTDRLEKASRQLFFKVSYAFQR
jgi:hypothetical protein